VERESLDVDVLVVGGGPAGLSAALRLAQLGREAGEPLSVAVLEKAREAGAHMLSGAVLDPRALAELLPDFEARGAPLAAPVGKEAVYFLTRRSKVPLPIIPPPLRNHGNYIVSLNRLVRWLAEQVESEGVDVFSGFAGTEVLYDGERVIGVRTGDRGVGRNGRRRSTFEPGVDIRATVTIFCDGVRGNLTKPLVTRLGLDRDREPQLYAIGIKELWDVPAGRLAPGTVMHTLGYPLRSEEFGGSFVYAMPEGRVAIGLVVGLDYKDPQFDPHVAFQAFKQHPLVAGLLAGGTLVKYGAKAIPEGGWHTVSQLYADGALLAGDCAGFQNSMRLKGIHLAMKTGMLAAESAFDAVRAGDASAARLERYQRSVEDSWVKRELYPVRNVHQAFEYGLWPGLLYSGFALLARGWWFRDPIRVEAGHRRLRTRADYYGPQRPPFDESTNAVRPDRVLTFDRLTNVHYSGTKHEEDQPVHLLVSDTDLCRTRCHEEYGNPCIRFCPASVYEMVDDGQGGKRLQINASNCVHCKTCDIMDPYQIITWVPPEGGGGPQYDGM
jgi:electron-transferring-flavoprotein dehydrogenase